MVGGVCGVCLHETWGWDQQDVKAFTALFMMRFISAAGPCGSLPQPGSNLPPLKPAAGLSHMVQITWHTVKNIPSFLGNRPLHHFVSLFFFSSCSPYSRFFCSHSNLTRKNEEHVTEDVSRLQLPAGRCLSVVKALNEVLLEYVSLWEQGRGRKSPLIPSSLPPASLQVLPPLTAQADRREEPLFGAKNNWSTVVWRHLHCYIVTTVQKGF